MHALLFDLDGTLTDPALGLTRCFAHALREMGRPVPPDTVLHACIGPPIQQSFPELLALPTDDPQTALQVQTAIAHFRARFSTVGMYENTVYPGVPEALTALQQEGARLFIATSKPVVYAREILRHFALASYFEAVYGSELSGERVAKGDVIAYLLAQERLPARTAVMVGDRHHDIDGAKQNGLSAAVGVTYGYGSTNELLAAGADRLCAHPAELATLPVWLAARANEAASQTAYKDAA